MIKMGKMEKANRQGKGERTKTVALLRGLLAGYLATVGLLLLLTLFVYRFRFPEKTVGVGICAIYVCSGLLAGFSTGRQIAAKRFLWGLAAGALYFAVLFIASLAAGHGVAGNAVRTVLVLFLCAASGMLGGMLS